jgi:hypothetical protein
MDRDAAFAIEIADEARRYGVRVVEVAGSLRAEATAEIVGRHLAMQSEANGWARSQSRRNVGDEG